MSLTDQLLIWRAERTLRRAGRAERRELRREMACYVTQAERDELLAIFDRYPDQVTKRYRDELWRQTRTRRIGSNDWAAFRPR
jgi:2-oxo-4-hydroxy-4-carboxy--5-ureidoimidazoline (OHCU) decarboxylase